MDQILGQVLRNAVWERLDTLSELADRADSPSLMSVARSEIPRLAEAWRVMLRAHEPDARGECPTCSTRWHRCKAPCTVWQVAHDHLVAGGLAQSAQTSPRPGRGRHTDTAQAWPRPDLGNTPDTRDFPASSSAPASPVSPPVVEQSTGRHALLPSTPVPPSTSRRALAGGQR